MTTEQGRKLRKRKWNNIVNQQVELAYYANISYNDIDEMSVFEKNTVYNKVKKIKEREKEKAERMKNNIKKNQSRSGSRKIRKSKRKR